MRIGLSLFVLSWCVSACGGASPTAEAPSGAELAQEEELVAEDEEQEAGKVAAAEVAGPEPIPTSCHREGEICTPSPAWVKKLCSTNIYPDVALALFHADAPFSRGYITRKTRAVNASGGPTGGEEWLSLDEEVILLYERSAGNSGMQVSGAEGGFDAIRWDGSCVTLDSHEVTTRKPPQSKPGQIQFRFLGDDTQDALKGVPEVRVVYLERRKECKGAMSGEVTKKCEQKDAELMRVIAQAVKTGALPQFTPQKRP